MSPSKILLKPRQWLIPRGAALALGSAVLFGASTPDGDRVDALATRIDAYEALHEPIDRPDPVDATRFQSE